ncbi:MAG: GTPase domain-containing protein [Methylococcales bacterium]|nr:GTPase domain-containing protein [Methylococcales bacterium]
MLKFIQLLNQRYQAHIATQQRDDVHAALYQQRIEQLLYTEAFMRKGELLSSHPDTPLQIVVIGPTQAGKSSISNLILNTDLAKASPLAGYTVHPQGFCHQVTVDDCIGLKSYFGRFQQLTLGQLDVEKHDCYSLTDDNISSPLLPESVFWDTPDFDSIDSVDYREGVIRTIALADIIVLVVSKEKYADQSVWEMMSAIEAFHQPTLICINKLAEGTEDLIINSLKDKWQHARQDTFPDTVPMFYQKETRSPEWPEAANDQFVKLARIVSHKKHLDYQDELLNKYWHQWLEPVVAEHEAEALWRSLVDQCVEEAVVEYKRDFLDHPHYYETFQNTIIELLSLLEVPGFASVLTKTRRVLTWPLRKLMSLGKKIISPDSQEEAILNQIGEHLLISLSDQLLEKIDSDTKQSKWWKDSYCLVREKKEGLLEDYEEAVDGYLVDFQDDVHKAANKLYNKLSEQPILLNSLRATRVTTDLAAIVLILETGGIGVHDLIITPAMLAITSLLTESAIGSYISKVEAELKRHQLKTVKEGLFVASLQQTLYALPEQLSKNGRFNISPEQLKQAEQQRHEKKNGIRLF